MSDLLALARPFLLGLNDRKDAGPFLAAYDMRILFDVTDGEPFHAILAGGRVQDVLAEAVAQFSNRDDLALFGSEAGFRMVFERRTTPAVAMYYGKMTPRGERAKHNQVAVAYTLLHMAQTPSFLDEL